VVENQRATFGVGARRWGARFHGRGDPVFVDSTMLQFAPCRRPLAVISHKFSPYSGLQNF
jgi:hypothetical protein